MHKPNAKSLAEIRHVNKPLRLIYTSDFSTHFFIKLVHFREKNYCLLSKPANLMRNRTHV